MITINALEDQFQSEARQRAITNKKVSPFRMFFVVTCVVPFLVAAFFFVPLVGQLLSLSSVFLTFGYIRARRSFKLLLATIAGVVTAGTALAIFGVYLTNYAAPGGYLLMGFCMAVSITYVVGISGAWWDFYNQ